MNNKILKNIASEEILKMKDEINYLDGQVVSKTIVQNRFVSITLFGFSKGEEISSHSSDGDALVSILSGKAKIIIDSKEYILVEGESIIMPTSLAHSLYALENFKMLLIVVFPISEVKIL